MHANELTGYSTSFQRLYPHQRWTTGTSWMMDNPPQGRSHWKSHNKHELPEVQKANATFKATFKPYKKTYFTFSKSSSFSLSFSPSLASLYLFEQFLRLGVMSTSSVCLPLQDESLYVFPNCKSLWIKASAKCKCKCNVKQWNDPLQFNAFNCKPTTIKHFCNS